MKSTKFILPAILVCAFTFTMCDYVTDPRDVDQSVAVFDTTKRVALLEEWTGHTCINCPDAARDIEMLDSIYDQSFVAISIHDDYFAEPCPPHPLPPCAAGHPGAFEEDFRCPTGVSYSTAHPVGISAPPQGMVNRIGTQTGTEVHTRGVWPGMIDSLVQEDACASMHIEPQYNASTRQLAVTVWGTWLQAYTGNINVAIMLTESGMVGWQTDGASACDSVFEFNHVLRECLNTPGSIAGSPLSTGTTAPGTVYSFSLASPYTIPVAFDASHCHLVAMIFDTTTGEVLQAWEEDVQ